MALPPARYVSVAAAVALLSLLRPATCPAADSLPAHGLMRLQRPGSGPMLDVAVSPDGSTLATATARGDVQLWRSSDGGMRTLLRAEAPADAVAFSADGTRLVATYADGTVRLWDARDGSMVRRLLVHPRGARVAVLSPDGHVVAGGGADGAIHLVEAETGNPVRRIEPVADENANVRAARPAAVRALAFSPDGSILAAGYERFNSSVRVWDPQTGREVARLNEDGNAVHALVVSPDGATLATAADTGQHVTLWETATWRPRRRLDTRGMPESPHAFSADGRSLWSINGNELWRWDLASGRRAQKFVGHRGDVTAAAAFPQGTNVVSCGDDGAAIVWDGRPAQHGTADTAARPEIRPEGLWGALAVEDAGAAYDAMWELVAAPAQTVPYLRNRLPRHEPVDAERVRKLIAQLDDERFTVRERAMKELGQVGDAAEPLLREQRAATASPEVGQRIDELLEGLVHGTGDADALRARRAVEVLERIGTPEARSALAEVAAGTSGAKLKSHARAALHRLGADAPPAGQ